jgi:hypothetical protein
MRSIWRARPVRPLFVGIVLLLAQALLVVLALRFDLVAVVFFVRDHLDVLFGGKMGQGGRSRGKPRATAASIHSA